MGLRNLVAGEALAPVVVVAVDAGEIELADALVVELAALVAERREARVVRRCDRLATRLQAEIGGERQELLALIRKGRGVLLLVAADVDALLEVDRAA